MFEKYTVIPSPIAIPGAQYDDGVITDKSAFFVTASDKAVTITHGFGQDPENGPTTTVQYAVKIVDGQLVTTRYIFED